MDDINELTIDELQKRIQQARELIIDLKKHIKNEDTAALLALSVIQAALR